MLEDLPVAPPPPPRTLTKDEIKAQRKAELHHLNLLKMRLQPIMDQIHRKYRKFRQPVIPFAQVAYLFDEKDPNFVRPDLAEGERRPFEIARDKEGTEGLREVATGRFFYNLETTTIEERLANGYYARPLDFYKDINRLYLDAKNIGDRDRTLKANELRTNVEVDVHEIGQTLSNQGIRFEEIYQRQLQRTKEAEERARKKNALQPVVDLIQSDIPGDGDSDSQGPVGIGIPLSRDTRTTGARFMVMSPKPNGRTDSSQSRSLTNGTSAPSRQDGEDTVMSGMHPAAQAQPDGISGPSFPWQRPPIRPLGDSTRANPSTQLSQRSAVTSVPPGVSPSAIQNDASTTKTSDPSTNRSSGNWSTQHTNTQHTNGLNSDGGDETQLIDTQSQNRHSGVSQGTLSERDWAHSQAAGMAQGLLPPRGIHFVGGGLSEESSSSLTSQHTQHSRLSNVTSLENILNVDPSHSDSTSFATPNTNAGVTTSSHNSGSGSGSSSQQPVIHEPRLRQFLNMLADQTSGCSVEQLEQINRELMDEIWQTRNEWNRMTVLSALQSVFNDTIGDIELVQGTLEGSQGSEDSQPGVSQEDGASMLESSTEDVQEPFIYLRKEE